MKPLLILIYCALGTVMLASLPLKRCHHEFGRWIISPRQAHRSCLKCGYTDIRFLTPPQQ